MCFLYFRAPTLVREGMKHSPHKDVETSPEQLVLKS